MGIQIDPLGAVHRTLTVWTGSRGGFSVLEARTCGSYLENQKDARMLLLLLPLWESGLNRWVGILCSVATVAIALPSKHIILLARDIVVGPWDRGWGNAVDLSDR